VYDESHVIQVDELEVRDNLKRLRGKEIVLVKVIWVGPTRESATSKSESRMKVSYSELFPSGNFRGRKFFLGGRVVTARFFASFSFICLICVYMCLCVINYPWV